MPRVGLTTESVVVAGADLADEIGFAALTPSELARRLGVRVPSLYAHVGGADDLRTRITLLALAELADRAAAAVAGRAGRDALVALGNVHRDYARSHPGRYDAARQPLAPDLAAASGGPQISQLTRASLRGYGLSVDDETHAVRLLGSLFHGFTALESAGGFSHSSPDSDTSWLRILEALDAMIQTWKAPR